MRGIAKMATRRRFSENDGFLNEAKHKGQELEKKLDETKEGHHHAMKTLSNWFVR